MRPLTAVRRIKRFGSAAQTGARAQPARPDDGTDKRRLRRPRRQSRHGLFWSASQASALLFGTLPVMTGIFSFALGIERLGSRFWLAALLGFGGAALVALGSGGGVSGRLWGDLLGLAAAVTWAWYSVAAGTVRP